MLLQHTIQRRAWHRSAGHTGIVRCMMAVAGLTMGLSSRLHRIGCPHIDFISMGSFAATILGLIVIAPTLILPQIHNLEDAKDALCAGNLDFVYTQTKAGSALWAITT